MACIYSVPVASAELAKHRRDVMNFLAAEKDYDFKLRNLFVDNSPVNTTWRLWLGPILCSNFMVLFTIGLAVDTHNSQLLAVVSIILFEFFFEASWCPLPWVYVPEIAPFHVRHIGTSMGRSRSGLFLLLLVKPH
jgi:Sugar (and other) transporter